MQDDLDSHEESDEPAEALGAGVEGASLCREVARKAAHATVDNETQKGLQRIEDAHTERIGGSRATVDKELPLSAADGAQR